MSVCTAVLPTATSMACHLDAQIFGHTVGEIERRLSEGGTQYPYPRFTLHEDRHLGKAFVSKPMAGMPVLRRTALSALPSRYSAAAELRV